jgi:hypothetical protein
VQTVSARSAACGGLSGLVKVVALARVSGWLGAGVMKNRQRKKQKQVYPLRLRKSAKTSVEMTRLWRMRKKAVLVRME